MVKVRPSHAEVDATKLSFRWSFKRSWWKALPVIVLIIAFLLSLFLGRYPVSLERLISVVVAKMLHMELATWSDTMNTVVFQVRLPRIMAAMLVGAALSASGAAYQGMFKNPLVSPDILGVSAGAGFGAALAIFFSYGIIGVQALAFLFGLLAVFLTCAVSTRIRNSDPALVLVLAGIVVGTLFSSSIALLKYMADPYDKLPAITFWLMGSLASITIRDVYTVILPMLCGAVPLYLLRWKLNVLSLGEEEAQALGIDTQKLRITVIICCTLMTASAVSISGMIGWVGLIIPHLARIIVGPNYKALMPASIVIGSSYLLLVDDLARVLASVEIPLGLLTSFIGAPFFIYLLQRTGRGWV